MSFSQRFQALIHKSHRRFNIEAIEDTELVAIDKKDMDFLYAHIAVWEEFGRKIWEAMSVRMIDQILNFQTLSAEQHYLEFMNNPELIQKIPVKQLAAVLGHYTQCLKPHQEEHTVTFIIYHLVVSALQEASTFES